MSVFKIRQRIQMLNALDEITILLVKYKNEVDDYLHELKRIEYQHDDKLKNAEENAKKQKQNIITERKCLNDKINEGKNKLENISAEIPLLYTSIEKAEEQLKNFHEYFILTNYYEEYKDQLVIEEVE